MNFCGLLIINRANLPCFIVFKNQRFIPDERLIWSVKKDFSSGGNLL
jgi:hypothetical protein